MRQGYENGFVFEGNDETKPLLAICLGSDHCAEHEWGINRLKERCGIDETVYGIDRRRVRNVPNGLQWIESSCKETRKSRSVPFGGFWLPRYDDNEVKDLGVHFYEKHTLWTGWSEQDFGAFSTDASEIAHLKSIFDGFAAKDICLWIGRGHVFKAGGLNIGFTSRIPKDAAEQWDTSDREREQLRKDFEATGIEDYLKKAGKHYIALSPRREKDGSLVFWLNPAEQRKDNYGWFTLSDLTDWTNGEGHIPMTPEQRKAHRK